MENSEGKSTVPPTESDNIRKDDKRKPWGTNLTWENVDELEFSSTSDKVNYSNNGSLESNLMGENVGGIKKEPLESTSTEDNVDDSCMEPLESTLTDDNANGSNKEPLVSNLRKGNVDDGCMEPLESTLTEDNVEGIKKEPLESTLTEDNVDSIKKEPLEPTLTEENVDDIKKEPLESTSTEDNVDDIYMDEWKNPLQNPLIIDYVYKYLNLADIKQCRLVNRKWNALSHPYLDKMSLIKMGSPTLPDPRGDKCNQKRSPRYFRKVMKTSERSFHAFRLTNFKDHYGTWPPGVLTKFLLRHKGSMEELNIKNIIMSGYMTYFSGTRFAFNDYFNLTPFISNHLTHLALNNLSGSRFIVPLHKLTTIKTLFLKHCNVSVEKECKLRAELLVLKHVKIIRNKNTLLREPALMNGLVELENLKRFELESPIPDLMPSVLFGSDFDLDMGKPNTVDILSLVNTRLINVNQAKWQINGKLSLRCVPFTEQTQMKFTDLAFEHQTINIDALPKCIEKLKLTTGYLMNTDVTGSPLNLPNLKYLEYFASFGPDRSREHDIPPHPLATLGLFINCKNLKTLNIIMDPKYELELNYNGFELEWLSPSIKNISVSGNFGMDAEREYKIEKLVIRNNELSQIFPTLRTLKSNHLILDLNSKFITWNKKYEKILMDIIKMPYESLTVGSLNITEAEFAQSRLIRYVDQKSKCYLFKDRKGLAITEKEFTKMATEF